MFKIINKKAIQIRNLSLKSAFAVKNAPFFLKFVTTEKCIYDFCLLKILDGKIYFQKSKSRHYSEKTVGGGFYNADYLFLFFIFLKRSSYVAYVS